MSDATDEPRLGRRAGCRSIGEALTSEAGALETAHLEAEMESESLKDVIKRELPGWLRDDPDFRACILDLTRREYAGRAETEDTLALSDYVPHERVLEMLTELQVLLLSIDRVLHNELIVTGKVFVYVTSVNPVLGVGPQPSDPADILTGTAAGRMHDYGDREGMRAFLLDAYRRWQAGSLCDGPRRIERYERRNLAGSLASVLDALTE